jgi:hypothetical protein
MSVEGLVAGMAWLALADDVVAGLGLRRFGVLAEQVSDDFSATSMSSRRMLPRRFRSSAPGGRLRCGSACHRWSGCLRERSPKPLIQECRCQLRE